MGSEFFWFLDILVPAVIAIYIFRGAHKGAVSIVIGAVSAIAAFLVAFAFSGVISDAIYDRYVRQQVGSYVSEQLGGVFGRDVAGEIAKVDMSKTLVNGEYLTEDKLTFDDKNTAVIDLSSVDLTETGIQYAELKKVGLDENFDYTEVKVGNIAITRNELEKYGLGNIVLARIIAVNATEANITPVFEAIGDRFSGTLSPSLKELGKQLENGSTDAIYSVVVSVISGNTADHGERIITDIISPMVLIPLRIIVFFILFAVVLLILTIIAEVTKLINRIPVVASVNSGLGAAIGLVQGILMLLIMCLVIRFVIALCGDTLVFLNRTTIDRTFIFRHIYDFGPLKIFGI